MDDLLHAIREVLQQKCSETELPKLGKEYHPVPFSKQHYHLINNNQEDLTLTFIDGGNAELLNSSAFSLSFIRVVAATFIGTKRKETKKTEFLLLTTAKGGEEIEYTTKIFPLTGNIFPQESGLSFSSVDGTLRQGMKRATPSSIGGVARRFSELLFAQHMLENTKTEAIILDGNLQEMYTNESLHLRKLAQLAQQQKKKILGMGKTTTLFTHTGKSFASLLSHQGGSWYYYPVAKTEIYPEIYFVKLHKQSKHVFMIESFGKIPESIFALLKTHAQDPVFLGYPYGLIEADRAARVSNYEANYLKMKIISLLGNLPELEQSLSTQNAHSFLDTISFTKSL